MQARPAIAHDKQQDQELLNYYYETETNSPNVSPWLLRFELDKKALLGHDLVMETIEDKLKAKFGDLLTCIRSEDNATSLVLHIRMRKDDSKNDETVLEDHAILRFVLIFCVACKNEIITLAASLKAICSRM